MYLIDTDHCIAVLRAKEPATTRLASVPDVLQHIAFVTVGELMDGVHSAPARYSDVNYRVTMEFVSGFDVIYPSFADALKWAEIRSLSRKQGLTGSDNDLWIAALAITRGLSVLTTNTKNFHMIPEVRFENWMI